MSLFLVCLHYLHVFVTPISSLARCDRSYPIRPCPIDCDRRGDDPIKGFGFPVNSMTRTRVPPSTCQITFLSCPLCGVWELSTPQNKPAAGFVLPGGHYSRDKRLPNFSSIIGLGAGRTLVKFKVGRPSSTCNFYRCAAKLEFSD